MVQLLPVNEVSGGETSPYSAGTAFALDPVYLTLDQLEDFAAAGGRARLADADRAATRAAGRLRRGSSGAPIRALKARAADRPSPTSASANGARGSGRRKQLERYIDEHRDWLQDYSLWRVLHDEIERAWWEWPEAWQSRQPAALAQAREEKADAILRCC